MNSPLEPGSPSPSTPSSGSPPPEEVNPQASSGGASHLLNLASQVTSSLSGASSKRRLGGSGPSASTSNRDPKSRRRGESNRGGWDIGKDSGKKEDLVDSSLVDQLRKEIGDPFLDIAPTNGS
ncbi:hypothetical protein BD779DRAFT_1514873 [Infundibulicybe gibba]|nr:hypothetical protein BD779DRAFT_1514873 [Infundibulicybe gibba]